SGSTSVDWMATASPSTTTTAGPSCPPRHRSAPKPSTRNAGKSSGRTGTPKRTTSISISSITTSNGTWCRLTTGRGNEEQGVAPYVALVRAGRRPRVPHPGRAGRQQRRHAGRPRRGGRAGHGAQSGNGFRAHGDGRCRWQLSLSVPGGGHLHG